MSTPVASYPDSSACTRVVPEPANGSSTVPPRGHMPLEQRLDELRDELAEVRVEAVDVLRPLALRQRRLRPGELEVVLLVEGFLGGRHDTRFAAAGLRLPRSPVVRRERVGDPRQTPPLDRHDLEADPDVRRLRVAASARSCAARRTRRRFSRVDGAERRRRSRCRAAPSPRRTSASRPAPDDQVELVAARPDVRAEDPVAPQAVVPERPPLARVHAAAGSSA